MEPQGASHVFIVHGSECRKREGNTCTFDPQDHPTRKGMMYVLDIKELLGADYKVESLCIPHLLPSLAYLTVMPELVEAIQWFAG